MEENQNVHQSVNQNYLVLAIVATIFGCCSFYGIGFVLGVIAIVFAAQVNGKARMGDYITATKYSDYAKKLSIVAIVITVISMAYMAYQVKTNPEFIEKVRIEYQKAIEESQRAK
ncbi:CD225/dispanin family protein [Weeksellaceae bacterium TAE3-ERU29]|nr:CD225/dispanin family protein [Weeksellaceae bacterium TAE3-ERU29]